MPCYHPWRTDVGNIASCGQCRGCRKTYRREWSLRCMHEAAMHERNSFLTLTYADEFLPPGGSLDGPTKDKPGAFALFMKRLRKEVGRVRYYHVGEYGTDSNRPHYHALLFGFDPPDKALLCMRGAYPVYTSELLRSLWTFGLSEVGSVTPHSAGYVTRYLQKRITGGWAKAKYGDREVEYGTMSRNPGLGAGWIDRFKCEVYPVDGVVVRGKSVRPPRYYDLRVGRSDAGIMDGVKLNRFYGRRPSDETPERLAVREECAIAQDALQSSGGSL